MTEPDAPVRPPFNIKRTLGFVVGLGLFAAAVAFALRNGGDAGDTLRRLRDAPPWLIALAIVLPALNWLLISMSFLIPMRRHAPIRVGEMLALIGAAWLLNYLPLRPGLFGRLAYHKAVNGIPIKSSVVVTLIGMACSGIAVLATLGLVAVLPSRASPIAWVTCLGAVPVVAGLGAFAFRSSGHSWLFLMFFFRYADLMIWVLRYWTAFRLAGISIGLAASIALASVCQLSISIPFIGNGLGVREWAIGLTAAHLPPGIADATPTVPAAVTAELFNRATEILIAVPVGLGGAFWLRNRRAR